MCFYLRQSWALLHNLARRLLGDAVDWSVSARRRMRFRVRSLFRRYDDVASPSPNTLPSQTLALPQHDTTPTLGLEWMPWFHNIDRKQAEEIVKKGGDGCFLVRPSIAHPLTLTLWHKERPYNIPISRRENGTLGLGTKKQHERTFPTVEGLVRFYGKEELVLVSGRECTGTSTLAFTPRKGSGRKSSKSSIHHIS